jgi:hypothetical protein
LAFLVAELWTAHQQRLTVKAIRASRGEVIAEPSTERVDAVIRANAWRDEYLASWLGQESFGSIRAVRLSCESDNDDYTVHLIGSLGKLRGLTHVAFIDGRLSAAAIDSMKTLQSLRSLSLYNVKVDSKALKQFLDGAAIEALTLQGRSCLDGLSAASDNQTLIGLRIFGKESLEITPSLLPPSISEIEIRGGTLDATTWATIMNHPRIKAIYISQCGLDCELYCDQGLRITRPKSVAFEWCEGISPSEASKLQSHALLDVTYVTLPK